eukprot:m.85486 g.85486  ORF g.85486 m.85486 type:complete len:145 (-) comp8744_c0_seq1:2239-2673(-)
MIIIYSLFKYSIHHPSIHERNKLRTNKKLTHQKSTSNEGGSDHSFAPALAPALALGSKGLVVAVVEVGSVIEIGSHLEACMIADDMDFVVVDHKDIVVEVGIAGVACIVVVGIVADEEVDKVDIVAVEEIDIVVMGIGRFQMKK